LARRCCTAAPALAFALALLGYGLGFGRLALEAMRTGGAGWVVATVAAAVFLPLYFWRPGSLLLALAAWAGLALVYVVIMLVTRAARVDEVESVLAVVRRGKA
jgi:hypothetical protein